MNEQFPQKNIIKDSRDENLSRSIVKILQKPNHGEDPLSLEELENTADILIATAHKKGEEINLSEIEQSTNEIIVARKNVRVSEQSYVTTSDGGVIPVGSSESVRDVTQQYSAERKEQD